MQTTREMPQEKRTMGKTNRRKMDTWTLERELGIANNERVPTLFASVGPWLGGSNMRP